MTMIHSPLEQFEVTPVWSLGFGEQFAFTNTALFGFIVMFAILGILSFGTNNSVNWFRASVGGCSLEDIQQMIPRMRLALSRLK